MPIATGSLPYVPPGPGCELAITSNEIFGLAARPERILIVGGGYIAVEFASIVVRPVAAMFRVFIVLPEFS